MGAMIENKGKNCSRKVKLIESALNGIFLYVNFILAIL